MRTGTNRIARYLVIGMMLVVVSGSLAGCAKKKFYRVTDLSDGTVFYTKEFDPVEAEDIGMARFVDAHTAALIRLEEYEAKRITKRSFRRAIRDN